MKAEPTYKLFFGFESCRRGQNPASNHSRALVHAEQVECEALATFAFKTWKENPPPQCDWIALVKTSGDYGSRSHDLLESHSFDWRSGKKSLAQFRKEMRQQKRAGKVQ